MGMAGARFRPIRDLAKAFSDEVTHARISPKQIALHSSINDLDLDTFSVIILIIVLNSTVRLLIPSCTYDVFQREKMCYSIASRPPAVVVRLTRHPIKHSAEDIQRRLGIASLHQSLPVRLDAHHASKALELVVEIFEMSHHIVKAFHAIVDDV